MFHRIDLLCLFVAVSIASTAIADDWASFRGSTGNGTAMNATLPTNWTHEDICWRTELPGYGWSGPIVFGDTVYLTAAVSAQLKPPKNMMAGVVDPSTIAAGKLRAPDIEIDWQVIAVSLASGTILWTHSATTGKPKFPVHASNSFATETCCADLDGVYAYFGATGTVLAVDHQGHERWRAELGAHKTVQGFGSGASPAIYDGILAVTCFNDEVSFVVGFETKTGKEVWRQQWSEKNVTAWGSPMIWNHSSRSELVVCGPGKIAGLEMRSGNELWSLPGFETFASSPTSDGDYLLFGNGGEGASGPLYGIRSGAKGDISLDPNNDRLVWKVNGAGTGWCSPVARNGYLFVPGKGLLSCYDSRDGKRLYRQRMPDMKTLTACPISTDDAVLFVDEDGRTFTIKIGPTFELLGSGKLEDTVWASPALSGDQLLIRGLKHLYCIRAAVNK